MTDEIKHYEKRVTEIRLLILIATNKLAKKAMALYQESNVPLHYQFHAHGTATNEILQILGIGSVDKTVLMSLTSKEMADTMLRKLYRILRLETINSGIALTVAVSGISSRLVRMIEASDMSSDGAIMKDGKVMTESEYTMVLAVVNQGFSEEVMEAARPVGASGGTVISGRRLTDDETVKFWGLSLQEEREIVSIIVGVENKKAVMQAIKDKCGLNSEAHGLVLSLPVESVLGLE